MLSSVWVISAEAEEATSDVPAEVAAPVNEDEEVKEDGLTTRFKQAFSYIVKGDSSEIVSEADQDLQTQRDAIAEQAEELSAARDEMLSKSNAHEQAMKELAQERKAFREMRDAVERCVLGAVPTGGDDETDS